MWFTVDFNSHKPVYKQIMEKIKSLISKGVLKKGDFLPSIRVLAKDLGVNVNTVARAYKELSREGVIGVVRGEGYVVIMEGKFVDEKLREFENFVEELKELGVDYEDILKVLRRVYYGKNRSES